METMKAVAEVSESTKAEAVAAVQRQCQEEVASLQAILKGEEPAPNTPTLQSVCLHPSHREYRVRKASNELQIAQQRKDCPRIPEYPFPFCRKTQMLSATLVQSQLGVAIIFPSSFLILADIKSALNMNQKLLISLNQPHFRLSLEARNSACSLCA